MTEEYTDFPIELRVKPEMSDDQEKTLYAEAETRLRKLAKKHHDIISVSITVDNPGKSQGAGAFYYEVTVTVNLRPNNVAATEKDHDVEVALRGALSAVERQVREKRERLRDH